MTHGTYTRINFKNDGFFKNILNGYILDCVIGYFSENVKQNRSKYQFLVTVFSNILTSLYILLNNRNCTLQHRNIISMFVIKYVNYKISKIFYVEEIPPYKLMRPLSCMITSDALTLSFSYFYCIASNIHHQIFTLLSWV